MKIILALIETHSYHIDKISPTFGLSPFIQRMHFLQAVVVFIVVNRCWFVSAISRKHERDVVLWPIFRSYIAVNFWALLLLPVQWFTVYVFGNVPVPVAGTPQLVEDHFTPYLVVQRSSPARLDCPFVGASRIDWFSNYEKLSNSSRWGRAFQWALSSLHYQCHFLHCTVTVFIALSLSSLLWHFLYCTSICLHCTVTVFNALSLSSLHCHFPLAVEEKSTCPAQFFGSFN